MIMRLEPATNYDWNVHITYEKGEPRCSWLSCKSADLSSELWGWQNKFEFSSRKVEDLNKIATEWEKDPKKAKIKAMMIGVAYLIATVALGVLAWYTCSYWLSLISSIAHPVGDRNPLREFFTVGVAPYLVVPTGLAPLFSASMGYSAFKEQWDFQSEKARAEQNRDQAAKILKYLHTLMTQQEKEWEKASQRLLEQTKSIDTGAAFHSLREHENMLRSLIQLKEQIRSSIVFIARNPAISNAPAYLPVFS